MVSVARSSPQRLEIQKAISSRSYVVDFFCADAHLIIELDGGQHAVRVDADTARTKILEAMGYLVLRFWNNDVMRNIDGVLEEILTALGRLPSEPPHPDPLPYGERELR